MNITQLKYVLEIARAHSMRAASVNLYISQPALSASIAELEEELGIVIFERTNKGVSITPEGSEFIVYAKKAVGQYEIMENRYLSKNSDKAYFSVSTQHYLFAVKAFVKTVQQFDSDKFLYSIHETKTIEVLENVRDARSEVGIVSFSGSTEDVMKHFFNRYKLEFVPLMRKETFIYLWKDHKLAGKKVISLDELKEYPCVVFDQSDDRFRYLTEEALADYEFDKTIRTNDRATNLEMIAKLGGYAIGSGMLSEEDVIFPGLVSVRSAVQDPLTIGYIIRKDSVLSVYAEEYIRQILKFKEIEE